MDKKYYSINIGSNNNANNNSNNESSIKIGSENKIDKSVVGNNNEVSFTNNENTIHYYGTRKNSFLHKMISELLIGYFGKTKVRNVGIGSVIAGTILTLSSGYNINLHFFFYFGVLLIFIGCLFIYALFHSNTTTCKKCNKEFAYYEYKNPDIQEIKESKRTIETTTTYLKCKYCGYEDNITKTEVYLR
ncbi:hypothetical protein [Methanosarcina sp. UBA5]|uniref:hypothetical protein n=1 Tax=Methanosarcina sp. UBA5 TaxID=1915593 RepID=UPI0025FCE58B|nr:hypothetical protein [Methanosarcina sp. UBA5]